MKFTNDWFGIEHQRNFRRHLKKYRGKPDISFLEIGTYEGKSALWLLENILTDPTSKITIIDTFKGSMELKEDNGLYERFVNNTKSYEKKMNVKIGKSQIVLRGMKGEFDFVYIDGSHQASDVLEDAILSFRLLRSDGIMIFDDYGWGRYPEAHNNPKLGIDAFVGVFKDKFKLLLTDYQIVLRKI